MSEASVETLRRVMSQSLTHILFDQSVHGTNQVSLSKLYITNSITSSTSKRHHQCTQTQVKKQIRAQSIQALQILTWENQVHLRTQGTLKNSCGEGMVLFCCSHSAARCPRLASLAAWRCRRRAEAWCGMTRERCRGV